MAKDKRQKKNDHVAITEKTGSRRKKKNTGRTVLLILLIVLLLAAVLFLVLVGKYALDQLHSSGDDTPSVDLTQFRKTADENKENVGYYVVGVLGKEGEATEALALVCHDKKAGTVNILQVPQETYLGETEDWAVKCVGDVWANPKPLDWCETCGQRLYPAAIADGRHAACGTPVTTKEGSSTVNLMSVFNNQYAMPVDAYFLFPQESFVKLVNLLDGLDVTLENPMKVGKIDYKKGAQTLDGVSALQYLCTREKEEQGEIERLVRQRKVFTALLQRLTAKSDEALADDYLGPLMNGSTPIRTNLPTKDMIGLVGMMRGIPLEQMTAYVMPGELASTGGKVYFSVHRAELTELLSAAFNPYGRPLTEADLLVTELSAGGKADTHTAKLSESAVAQQGAATTTATGDTAGTTTTAKG